MYKKNKDTNKVTILSFMLYELQVNLVKDHTNVKLKVANFVIFHIEYISEDTYIHTYVCMYVCMYLPIHTYVCIYQCMSNGIAKKNVLIDLIPTKEKHKLY